MPSLFVCLDCSSLVTANYYTHVNTSTCVNVMNSIFFHCTTQLAGGGALYVNANASVSDCMFYNCTAPSGYGGAVELILGDSSTLLRLCGASCYAASYGFILSHTNPNATNLCNYTSFSFCSAISSVHAFELQNGIQQCFFCNSSHNAGCSGSAGFSLSVPTNTTFRYCSSICALSGSYGLLFNYATPVGSILSCNFVNLSTVGSIFNILNTAQTVDSSYFVAPLPSQLTSGNMLTTFIRCSISSSCTGLLTSVSITASCITISDRTTKLEFFDTFLCSHGPYGSRSFTASFALSKESFVYAMIMLLD